MRTPAKTRDERAAGVQHKLTAAKAQLEQLQGALSELEGTSPASSKAELRRMAEHVGCCRYILAKLGCVPGLPDYDGGNDG